MSRLSNRVRETTTTVGIGSVNLEGSSGAYRAFSSSFDSGDAVDYCIVGASEWEVGRGVLTSGSQWTLSRSTVYNSSNSDNLVDFSPGTKQVFNAIPAEKTRVVLNQNENLDYYVNPSTGSDSNSGLSVSKAFATIQHAVDIVCNTLDNGASVTIYLAPGTYNESITLNNYVGSSYPSIIGDTSAPDDYVISTVAQACVTNDSDMRWEILGVKLVASSGGIGLHSKRGYTYFNSIEFGACETHILVDGGAHVLCDWQYSITGNATNHIKIEDGSMTSDGTAITVGSSLTFTDFVSVRRGTLGLVNGTSFSTNVATGNRYLALPGGTIDTANSGSTFLPGNASGSVVGNGYYY